MIHKWCRGRQGAEAACSRKFSFGTFGALWIGCLKKLPHQRHGVNLDHRGVDNVFVRKLLPTGVDLGGAGQIGNLLGILGILGIHQKDEGLFQSLDDNVIHSQPPPRPATRRPCAPIWSRGSGRYRRQGPAPPARYDVAGRSCRAWPIEWAASPHYSHWKQCGWLLSFGTLTEKCNSAGSNDKITVTGTTTLNAGAGGGVFAVVVCGTNPTNIQKYDF